MGGKDYLFHSEDYRKIEIEKVEVEIMRMWVDRWLDDWLAGWME